MRKIAPFFIVTGALLGSTPATSQAIYDAIGQAIAISIGNVGISTDGGFANIR